MRASGPLAALFLAPSLISALPIPFSNLISSIKDNASPQLPLQNPHDLTSRIETETPISAEDASAIPSVQVETPEVPDASPVPSIEVEKPEVPLLHVEVKSAECHPITITLDGASPQLDGIFTAADGSPIRASLSFICEETAKRNSGRASWGPPLVAANALLFLGLVLCSIMQYARSSDIPARLPDLEPFFPRAAKGEHDIATQFDSKKYCFEYPVREKVLLQAPTSMEEELAGFRDVVELVDDMITAEKGSASFR